MPRIVISIDVPDGCQVHVSADAAQCGGAVPPISTRPDTAPCSHRLRDWFATQDQRERLRRRKGTVLEGRGNA